jgi:hypothetical protein
MSVIVLGELVGEDDVDDIMRLEDVVLASSTTVIDTVVSIVGCGLDGCVTVSYMVVGAASDVAAVAPPSTSTTEYVGEACGRGKARTLSARYAEDKINADILSCIVTRRSIVSMPVFVYWCVKPKQGARSCREKCLVSRRNTDLESSPTRSYYDARNRKKWLVAHYRWYGVAGRGWICGGRSARLASADARATIPCFSAAFCSLAGIWLVADI